MTNAKEFVLEYLRSKEKDLGEISHYIWSHPETRFQEFKSASFLIEVLEKEGFLVQKGAAGIETAFIGTFGQGAPYIGFLGEFDALPGLSQEAGASEHCELEAGGNGHGCGHNLLGTGALSAALAVKAYIEKYNVPGTVQFFGCPGEEGGSGKTFMVREGVFDHLDVALTWHPSSVNSMMNLSSLANYQVYFRFKGTTSHAAISPHLGRSALDAVELMNVGANYLREHIIPEARLHYAITRTGGSSPNVVQADAEVLYLIRAPQVQTVDEIYQRVCKIAQGAALMTETELTVKFDKACSNYLPNRALEEVMYEKLVEVGAEPPTEAEIDFAQHIWSSLSENEQNSAIEQLHNFGYSGDGHEFEGKYLADHISTYKPSDRIMMGSTDVGDVSWVVPTAQCAIATAALGTPLHTWQMVAQGVTSFAHRGMLRAGATMALTGIEILKDPRKLAEVQDEHAQKLQKRPYECPIPADVKPSTLQK